MTELNPREAAKAYRGAAVAALSALAWALADGHLSLGELCAVAAATLGTGGVVYATKNRPRPRPRHARPRPHK